MERTCKVKGCSNTFFAYTTIQNKCREHALEAAKIEKYPVKQCAGCGDDFNVRRPSLAAKQRYCSQDCAYKAANKQEARRCRVCGNEFMFQPSQQKAYKNAGVACSRKCAYEYLVRKNAHAPITDKYGRTGRVADKKWQKAVRERDEYICQRCGIFDEYIDTHHIAFRSQRPDLKHVVSNGVCLCRSCHQWVHRNPREAKAAGFISSEKYGVQREAERRENIKKGRWGDGKL